MSNEAAGAGSAVVDEQLAGDLKVLAFLDCLQRIDRPNVPFDRMLDRFRNNVEERRGQIERAERDKQRQLIREQRKQENRERRIKTEQSVRKLLFVAALIGLAIVTVYTLLYAKAHYGERGADCDSVAVIGLMIAFATVGITYGMNVNDRGFDFWDGVTAGWVVPYVGYVLLYNVAWIAFTNDIGVILVSLIYGAAMFGEMLFLGWLSSKIFSRDSRRS